MSMPEEHMNIYKAARRESGYTQEAAAEVIAVSVESIRAYENGYRIPPNDIVERMAQYYHTPHLVYQHLQDTNCLIPQIVPRLQDRSILEMAVRMYLRLTQFNQEHSVDRLMAMAEDGQIDDKERPEFESIMDDLRGIIQSGLELDVFA